MDYHVRLTSQELQVREGCDISPCVCSGSCSSQPRVDFHEIEFRDTDRYGQAHAEKSCAMRYALTRKKKWPRRADEGPNSYIMNHSNEDRSHISLGICFGFPLTGAGLKNRAKRFDHFDHTIFLTYMQKV